MNKDIVITGIGIVSASGLDKDSFWRAIVQKHSSIKPVSGFNTSEFNSHTAAEVLDFNPRDYINRRSIRNLDRICRFAISASKLALDDAGISIDDTNRPGTGIALGSMFGGWISIAEFHRQMLEYKLKRVDPLLFPNTVPNSPASQISIEFGLKGPNTSLGSGFACGSDAIGWGLNYLRLGRAKIMLSGGTEELSYWLMGSFDKLGYLSRTNNGNAELCRPFDKQRNGLVLGEGAAILVLETLKSAQERDAKIYSKVIGYGSAFNSRSICDGLTRSVNLALEDAEIVPRDIDYIICEGNALIDSDREESVGIKRIFGDNTPVSSIKPIIGHTLGASGTFNAIAGILAMQHKTAAPTINYREKDPQCDSNCISSEKIEKQINIVLSISLSPDGNSSCLIFKYEN